MFPGITGNRDRPFTTDSHDLRPSEDEQNCRMQDIGATLDAVKAAQARAENTDAVFAQLWRERTAWAKDCLEAHGINDKIAARDAALAARFAEIDTDDKDPLVQLLARDASLAGTSSSQIELSSDDQNGEIKSDCERLESALQRFFFATKPSHRSSTLRLQIIDVLERCEELLASPNLRAVRNLRQGLADLESVVPRRHIGPWRALQEATSLVVRLARKACVISTTSAVAARNLRTKKLQQKKQIEQDWKAKIGVKRRKSAAGLSSRTSAGSLTPEGLVVLRLVLYLHDRGCVARDLLRATESAQAQVEYAAAECASADLARLVARFGTVELEHRRRHLLARWMAAEALSGELIASSRLTHHVEAYISALEQKHNFVRGASQSLASRWPELSESVYEPLYHEIDRPLSSSSEIVAPIPLGQDAHNELPIADFIKLLLQEDDSGMCNSVQIPALCALSLETSQSPKSSSSPKTSQHAAGAAWGQNAGQRPPWNPSVLVHDPIRTRGGAEPIGKRQLAHLFSSNSSLAVRTEKDNIQRAMYAVSTSARSPMATPTSDAKATLSPSLVKARIDAVLLAD